MRSEQVRQGRRKRRLPRLARALRCTAEALARPALPLALVLVLQAPLSAAVITVGPSCTLVQAIDAANDDSVVGSCTAGSGADTIELTGDVTLTTMNNMGDGPNGLPSVTTQITLDGGGFTIQRDDAAPDFRIFYIGDGHLTLEDVTISNGKASSDGGGGIYNGGTVILRNSTVSGNSSSGTGLATGGGIFNTNFASLTVENSVLADNSAGTAAAGVTRAYGGGIYTSPFSSTTLRNTTVTGNQASATSSGGTAYSLGGGVFNLGNLEIMASTFFENSAAGVAPTTTLQASGGAIASAGTYADLTLTNSTVTQNFATGLAPTIGLAGGGVLTSGGTAELLHATLSGNYLSVIGSSSSVSLQGPALRAHAALSIDSSIVDGSGSNACVGLATAGTANFGKDCVSLWENVTGLLALASNGGSTQTHALDPGSNARNAAGLCPTLPTDQRGVSRRSDCDSGAYEVNECADDGFEAMGQNLTDDTCFGKQLSIGSAESHLHCDEDWVWVVPAVGKTYEIKTVNLTNGADTVIEISTVCGPALASDDNGGLGTASKLFHTAFADTAIDIRVTEAHESYNPGSNPPTTVEGYDVVVTCVEDCGSTCSPPDLTLMNDAVAVPATYEACSNLMAEEFTIEGTADIDFRAGNSVIFKNGVTVEGDLTVEIDSTLLP